MAFLLIGVPADASTSVLSVGSDTGGVVNGAQVLGATTGNAPLIGAQGSDTDVGLIFNTQGNGALNLETAASGNVILAPASGSVTIPAFTTSGIIFNNASGVLSSGTALPNGTTATTQSSGDNSTKVATTAYVDNAAQTLSGMVWLATVNASNSSAVTFTSNVTSAYNKYKIEYDSVLGGTNGSCNTTLVLQISTDGGSSWISSGYNGTAAASGTNSGYYIAGSAAASSTSTQGMQGTITFSSPAASAQTNFFFEDDGTNFNGTTLQAFLSQQSGTNSTTSPINALRIVDVNGSCNKIYGNFHLYGLKGT